MTDEPAKGERMNRDPVDGSPLIGGRTFRAIRDEQHDETFYYEATRWGHWREIDPSDLLDDPDDEDEEDDE